MDAKRSRAELEAHAEWCAGKMAETRTAIGDALVCVSDDNGNVAPNPAFNGYLSVAKEFRCAVKQLAEMGEVEEETKSSLSSLRLIMGNKKEAI